MTDESLFDAVLAQPPQQRQAFLASACKGDAALLERLQRLLAAHERASGILDRDKGAGGTAAYAPPPSIPLGTIIADRFKILECLGEGGMGTVCVAEQTQPVRRKVA